MKRFISSLFLLLAAINVLFAANTIDGTWRFHPAFDKFLTSLASSENRLYFLMQQQEYRNNSKADVATPSGNVFFIDNHTHSMKSLATQTTLSGNAATLMRYNPLHKYLLIGYSNGMFDIVHDDMTVTPVSDLVNEISSGNPICNDISFSLDGEVALIATSFGYIEIRDSDSSMKRFYLGRSLKSITLAGKNLFTIVDDDRYLMYAPTGATSFEEFKPLPIDAASSDSRIISGDGSLISTLAIMPIAENALGLLSRNSDNTIFLSIAIRKGDKWIIKVMDSDRYRLNEEVKAVGAITEINCQPNRDGYYVHSNNIGYQLIRQGVLDPNDPDILDKAVSIRYKVKDGWKESASWDFSLFWFYEPREGFYSRQVKEGYVGKTVWLDPSEMVRSPFPTAFIPTDINWHPQRGFVMQSHGVTKNFSQALVNLPPQICSYRDGIWSNLSPAYHTPDFALTDEALASRYINLKELYPMSNASGAELDPDDPDLLYAGSLTSGMARFDLGNPKANILHLSFANDKCAGFPGFFEVAPVMENWKSMCSFSVPRFDNNGNLWTVFNNLDNQMSENKSAEIWIWTSHNRKASRYAHDNPSDFKPWTKLTYPGIGATNYQLLMPLKNTANTNLIALATNGYDDPLYIIDTNGTVESTEDDKVAQIENITDSKGGLAHKYYIMKLAEDPATGYLWICTDTGIFYFPPTSAFYDSMCVHVPRPYNPDTTLSTDIFNGLQVNDVAFDSFGRKWIATHGNGLFCLSDDNKFILGHWDSHNSPLVSDKVMTVACNPDVSSIMVATDMGLMEFLPDVSNINRSPSNTSSVHPSVVTPDYQGWITISGLRSNYKYLVLNTSGNTVKELRSDASGTLFWDATGLKGERAASGRYIVSPDRDTSNSKGEIILLN